MPCYSPIFASYIVKSNGKKELNFKSEFARAAALLFRLGTESTGLSDNVIQIPCGRCIGCRLEKSRQWALRCMHEASQHEDNCFITLTYADEKLPHGGTLVKKHYQDFMKRLRRKYDDRVIRYFACGEYGELLQRPHYHACIFGLDFEDKKYWKTANDQKLYISDILSDLWGYGHISIGDLTFDSAAYVARYCTKKLSGSVAAEHYGERIPEFAVMSLKPGIGYNWYEKYKSDCYPSDYLIVNGKRCKPPRFYDKKLELEDLSKYEMIRDKRIASAKNKVDNSYKRLLVREKCKEIQVSKLVRKFEISGV